MRPEDNQIEGEVALDAPFTVSNELNLLLLIVRVYFLVSFMLIE